MSLLSTGVSPVPVMPTIQGLFVYPVKSCRGIAMPAVEVTARGLRHDRDWLIVAPAAGGPSRFVTQRDYPRLALIHTALSDSALTLSASGVESLTVEFGRDGTRGHTTIWRDIVPAIDQGAEASDWISAFVGADLRLMRFDPDVRRLCNPDYAGDSGAHTAFADGYPVLVISTASLDDLNHKLVARKTMPLPMNRFRPNVVIEGLEAYDEDHLATIESTGVELRLVKPCTRCQITTTDQESTRVGIEPLRTLAGYRNNARLGGVTFGMNAIVGSGVGAVLREGSDVGITWAF